MFHTVDFCPLHTQLSPGWMLWRDPIIRLFHDDQQHVAKSQMEIQKKERDLTKPIIDKMQKIISDLAKKEGYTAILEKSEQLVLFAQPSIDLTDKVVKEYNK